MPCRWLNHNRNYTVCIKKRGMVRPIKKEDKLMHSSAQYLMEGLVEPWIISDLSGRTRLSNQAARKLLEDYSPEELGIPESIRSALCEADGNKIDTVEVLVSSAGLKIGFAIRLQRPKTV